MGWVTLTLRKKELKVEHAYYQLRDLQISREKRAMARGKQANSTQLNNDKKAALAAAKEQYEADKASVYNGTTSADSTTETQTEAQGETQTEGSQPSSSGQLNSTQLYNLNEFSKTYEEQKEAINSEYDDEMAMLEEESADAEAALDVEQVDVESQMEAISEEMSAVSDAISTEIQNSTIKLS